MISADRMLPVHDHFSHGFDAFSHDERCMGDCYHCGGCHTPFPDTPELRCIYCEDGSCTGCNPYALFHARERGLLL